MAVNKTQIPKEAIEGPAGMEDKIEICSVDMQEVILDGNFKTKISNKNIRKSPLSTELADGVSIKAYEGNNRNKDEVSRD